MTAVILASVSATVALQRMYIWSKHGTLNACELDTKAHTLLTGGTIHYTAYATDGHTIGHTKVTPMNDPVTQVTETTT